MTNWQHTTFIIDKRLVSVDFTFDTGLGIQVMNIDWHDPAMGEELLDDWATLLAKISKWKEDHYEEAESDLEHARYRRSLWRIRG